MKCNVVQIYFTKLTFMAYNISLLPLQTKKRRFWLLETVSTLALIVNISIESVLFLFQKPNICEFVFIELTPLDHARKILMQKILFIYALIFWSRKDNENYGNLYHHFIHGIKKITPSLLNHEFWTENAPIIFSL